jgi:hypothetical protein
MALSSASRQNVTFPLRLGDVLGARLSQRTCLGLVPQMVRTTTNRLSPTHSALAALAGFHSRFGRGRGKGTARRSTAICPGCVTNGVEDVNKATIGSSGADIRAAAALGIEPVSSSLVGTCRPPPLIFRTASRLTTRIVATPMLSSVWRLGVSHGTAHNCRILI